MKKLSLREIADLISSGRWNDIPAYYKIEFDSGKPGEYIKGDLPGRGAILSDGIPVPDRITYRAVRKVDLHMYDDDYICMKLEPGTIVMPTCTRMSFTFHYDDKERVLDYYNGILDKFMWIQKKYYSFEIHITGSFPEIYAKDAVMHEIDCDDGDGCDVQVRCGYFYTDF